MLRQKNTAKSIYFFMCWLIYRFIFAWLLISHISCFFSPLKLDDVVQSEVMRVCSTCGEFSGRITGTSMRQIKYFASAGEVVQFLHFQCAFVLKMPMFQDNHQYGGKHSLLSVGTVIENDRGCLFCGYTVTRETPQENLETVIWLYISSS